MAEAEKVIRIRIDSSGAEQGARRVNQAIASIGRATGAQTGANDNHTSSLGRLTSAMNDNGKAAGVMSRMMDNIRGSAGSAIPMVGGLVGKLAEMGPQAAIIATVAAALIAVGVAAINAARQTQMWKANLLTVTKSSDDAKAAYAGLVNFARETPFSLEQSVQGFVKLRALGLSTSSAIMTSYGNTAAAMGKDMSQMIEAVADATTFEFERLKEFGIKAKQSGNDVAFTFQGVTTTVGKNAAEIEKYLVGIGATNFGGAMARQMDTINGGISNLSDSIFLMFARLGEGELGKLVGNIANTIASGVSAITPLLGGIMDVFAAIGRIVWELIKTVGNFFAIGFGGADGATSLIEGLAIAFTFVGQWASAASQIVFGALSFIAQVAGLVVNIIRGWFQKLFGWMLPSFDFAGQSAGEALVGILRAAQYVAGQLPLIFKTALDDLKKMFTSVGTALAASLSGDFSKWGSVDTSMSASRKIVSATWQQAQSTFGDQKANRQWIDDAAGRFGGGDIDSAAVRGGPSASAGGNPANDKADAAKKAAESYADLLRKMGEEVVTAGLLKHEAEEFNKVLEAKKILGDKFGETQRQEILGLMEAKRLQEAMGKMRQTAFESENELVVLGMRRVGLSDQEQQVEDMLQRGRLDYLNSGGDLLALSTTEWKNQEAITAEKYRQLVIMKDQQAAAIALGREGAKLIEQYQTSALSPAARAAADRDKRTSAIMAAVRPDNVDEKAWQKSVTRALEGSAKDYADAMSDIADEFHNSMLDAIGDIADAATELFGDAIGNALGGLLTAIEAMSSGKNARQTGIQQLFGGFEDMFGKVSDSLGDTGKIFGKGGEFFKGLSNTMAGLGMGATIGQGVAGIGKLFWKKFSSTGAQLGGAVGGAVLGPIGALTGSLLGGTIGGLLKKTKQGYATVTSNGVTTGGNNKDMMANAGTAGDSITASLNRIANQLGGTVGGFGNITVGQRDGDWRVNGTGTSLKTKKGAMDFGDDAEAAVRYAIQMAVEKGAIQGLRASTSRLLRAGDDVEAQIEKALQFEGVFKTLEAMKDPVKGVISAITDEFKGLTAIFREAGATAAEYAQLEELKTIKIKQAMEEQTSTLREIMDTLNGSAGGTSPLAILTRDMAEFNTMRDEIAAGKQVDQSAYSDVVGDILENLGNLYGTNSTEYQSVIGQLREATSGAITNVESAFGTNGADATVNAVNAQTNALLQSQAQTNDYLAQMAAYMAASQGGNIYQQTLNRTRAVNGELRA